MSTLRTGPDCARLSLAMLLIVLATAALLPGAVSAEGAGQQQAGPAATVLPQTSLPDLEDEVMCPICGTLLGMSRAPAAERQRVFMRGLIEEGKSDQEIKDALVAEYGPQVLALPDDEDTNFFVYVLPLAGLILAALAVFWAAIRWRRNRGPETAPGAGGAAAGPSGADSSRLDRDLADFDR